jgi:hypothetical protein
VPIVGVPFMNEQLLNCQRTVTRGFGVVSPEAPASRKEGVHYTRKGMASLIKQVCNEFAGKTGPHGWGPCKTWRIFACPWKQCSLCVQVRPFAWQL